MDQQHVFHGFQCGEKEQWSLLSDQIVGVNSRLLQEALQSLEQPANRQVNVPIQSLFFPLSRFGKCCCALYKTKFSVKPFNFRFFLLVSLTVFVGLPYILLIIELSYI